MVVLLRHVFGLGGFVLEKPNPGHSQRRPPTDLTREEVRQLLANLVNPWKLVAQIQYGSGLRLMEALRLRVKDIDFGQGTITVGYKSSWIAVHTKNMGAVVSALGLRDPHPCSWADGVGQGYSSGRVLVTPPLRGYVLCASSFLPEFPTAAQQRDEIAPIIEGLARQFDDVQYFFTHRVVEAHAWARFTEGKCVRIFAVSDFQKLRDIGLQTEAESKVQFPLPSEEDVMHVAG